MYADLYAGLNHMGVASFLVALRRLLYMRVAKTFSVNMEII